MKKCMPRNCAGRDVTAASAVIEIDDVFEATSAVGFARPSMWRMILSFRSRFSVAASMTRSQDLRSS